MKDISISEIKALANEADEKELSALRRAFAGDPRSGVGRILDSAQRRLEKEAAEARRLSAMYSYEREFCDTDEEVCVGLDEVGRGPIAGPVAVGAVVLPRSPIISGLNDSKKVPESRRAQIAREIEAKSVSHAVVFVDAKSIDEKGITRCLLEAFSTAISSIEKTVHRIDRILLDGNPMNLDPRERNIVKGDSKCASIAAASIIAKVSRDALMKRYDEDYPQYGFARNKGYGTQGHIGAIKEHGICDIHRKTFCSGIVQETLF